MAFYDGYYGQLKESHGVIAEFEIQKFYSEDFALPLRSDISFLTTPDYNSLSIDIHKGFRKYLKSGIFIEQSVGLGATANFYKVESIWYYDNYGNVIAAQPITLASYAKQVEQPMNIFTQDISLATYISYSSDKEIVAFQLNGSSDGMMLDGMEGM